MLPLPRTGTGIIPPKFDPFKSIFKMERTRQQWMAKQNWNSSDKRVTERPSSNAHASSIVQLSGATTARPALLAALEPRHPHRGAQLVQAVSIGAIRVLQHASLRHAGDLHLPRSQPASQPGSWGSGRSMHVVNNWCMNTTHGQQTNKQTKKDDCGRGAQKGTGPG